MKENMNTDKIYKHCSEIANQKNILEYLGKKLKENVFAGPADIPKLAYLVFLTGMLERPVSLVIKGPSGSGKSFSLAAARQFIPPDAYEQFEGMSEKALVYLKDLDLKHKHLVIGEASGLADGDGRTLLRQLLSEGHVRYATVQSTDKGMVGTELPTLEGPTGLIMTTTATGLHPEDESRMLSVTMNESPELIAEALMAQALGIEKKAPPIDTAPWHALYEFVRSGPRNVQIPFAKDLVRHLPKTHDRIKRDFPQVLSLITAHALLHSCTREKVGQDTVVANAQDYGAVRELVNQPLSQGLAVAVPEGIRLVVEGVEKYLQASKNGTEAFSVSQTKLSELLQRDASVISRNVKKAIELGFLQNDNIGQGREARLRIGERKLPSGSVLPPVDVLFPTEIEKRPIVAQANSLSDVASWRKPAKPASPAHIAAMTMDPNDGSEWLMDEPELREAELDDIPW